MLAAAMAPKSNGKDELIAVLERIETSICSMDQRLTSRLDRIVENTGRHWRDHEKRLAKLELAIARLRAAS